MGLAPRAVAPASLARFPAPVLSHRLIRDSSAGQLHFRVCVCSSTVAVAIPQTLPLPVLGPPFLKTSTRSTMFKKLFLGTLPARIARRPSTGARHSGLARPTGVLRRGSKSKGVLAVRVEIKLLDRTHDLLVGSAISDPEARRAPSHTKICRTTAPKARSHDGLAKGFRRSRSQSPSPGPAATGSITADTHRASNLFALLADPLTTAAQQLSS